MADTTILEKCITLGPWGSLTDREWKYIPEGFIKKIRISHDDKLIHSIEFHSQCSEGATKRSFFGSEGGKRMDTIIIDYPDEYLTSISGTTTLALTSLCFHTNQNRYGPYCSGLGNSGHFSYDGKGGVIVGFHGHGVKYIDGIGIYVMPTSVAMGQNSTSNEKCISLGPRGSSQGKEWTYVPEGCIKKICISRDNAIKGIEFHSYSTQGASQKSFFGVQGGSQTDMICIDYPDEYLTSITGTTGTYVGQFGVTSICFHTNRNWYAYGNSHNNTPFSFDCKGGVIVGFHGRHNNSYITAIGSYVMPKSLAMNLNSTFEEYSKPEKCCRMAKLEIPRDVGPWGASGGKPWDDGVFQHIKQVRVQLGYPSKVIFGIQFKYVKKNGDLILSRLHGGTDEDVSEVEINLDGVEEYLTGISGFYGPFKGYDGLKGITSITFHTNKGKHGPYGQESEGAGYVYFTSTPSSGKVVGFHGRNNDEVLTALGVHMEYL